MDFANISYVGHISSVSFQPKAGEAVVRTASTARCCKGHFPGNPARFIQDVISHPAVFHGDSLCPVPQLFFSSLRMVWCEICVPNVAWRGISFGFLGAFLRAFHHLHGPFRLFVALLLHVECFDFGKSPGSRVDHA